MPNPYHDSRTGRFTSKNKAGGTSSAGGSAGGAAGGGSAGGPAGAAIDINSIKLNAEIRARAGERVLATVGENKILQVRFDGKQHVQRIDANDGTILEQRQRTQSWRKDMTEMITNAAANKQPQPLKMVTWQTINNRWENRSMLNATGRSR